MNNSYEACIEWIESRAIFGIRPGLNRMEYLLKILGQPHNELKIIHIGGTNGKGSTTTFLKELLQTSGFKVGTFTSPFMETLNEEISINGVHISNDDFSLSISKIQPIVEEMDEIEELKGVTKFEIITAAMFLYFCQYKVQVAVIEVGLGGLLDSTNVVNPLICGITTVGMDHVSILGDTLAEIAEQKAGIIKRDIPVVTGKIINTALEVIKNTALEKNSKVICFGEDYTIQSVMLESKLGDTFSFNNNSFSFPNLKSNLIGTHQMENAAMAIQIFLLFMEMQRSSVSINLICESLNKAFIPGRMEVITTGPTIILDGAHNVEAMLRLQKNTCHIPNLHILFSSLKTKELNKMLCILEEMEALELVLTTFQHEDALTSEDMECYSFIPKYLIWKEAFHQILEDMTEHDTLLITGSLYFLSEVRRYLKYEFSEKTGDRQMRF